MAIFASFARYIFEATIIIVYYVSPYRLFIDTETYDLEWHWIVMLH